MLLRWKPNGSFHALAFPKFEITFLLTTYEGIIMASAMVLKYQDGDYSSTVVGG